MRIVKGVTTDDMGLDSEGGVGVTWGTAYHGDNVPGNDVSRGRRGRGQYGRGLHDGTAEMRGRVWGWIQCYSRRKDSAARRCRRRNLSRTDGPEDGLLTDGAVTDRVVADSVLAVDVLTDEVMEDVIVTACVC
jgi:hypothetical protein